MANKKTHDSVQDFVGFFTTSSIFQRKIYASLRRQETRGVVWWGIKMILVTQKGASLVMILRGKKNVP